MTRTRPLVLFDGDCAFCTTSIQWFARTFPAAFDTAPYQRTDVGAYGLTAAQCHARLRWIDHPEQGAASRRHSGAGAVAAMLRVGGRRRGGPSGALARTLGTVAAVPPISWIAEAAYVVVAANRTRLPGGTPACAL